VPAGGFLEHTLLAQVRRRDPRWSPMHRLGRGTSGLVLFAGTEEARSRVQSAWRGEGVEKWYRALAGGPMPRAPFEVEAPIGPVEHPVLGSIFAASPAGRRASSHVEPIAPAAEGWVAAVRIATGRPHQIRIHLAFAGHPLVGDPIYGPGGLPRTAALPGEGGYCLHSWRLGLVHPRTGRRLELEAPLPERLRIG
jgi:23S rRNA pseudouridine1911/1915/1917 synthase